MDPVSFLPLAPRDYLILFSLAREAQHGYGIVRDVEESSSRSVRLDPANLYRSIRRMVANGLVEDAEAPEDEDHAGSERRRYYRATELGRRVVRMEAARLAELADAARASGLIPEVEPRS